MSEASFVRLIRENFKLTPDGIIETFRLRRTNLQGDGEIWAFRSIRTSPGEAGVPEVVTHDGY